jgi:hypothetical protein
VKKIPFLFYDPCGKIVESLRSHGVTGQIHRVGYQGRIPRPNVGIGIAIVSDHVGIVPRDDAPLPIELGAENEKASIIEFLDGLGKIRQWRILLAEPQVPVIRRSFDQASRMLVLDQPVQPADLRPIFTGTYPVKGLG